MVVGSGLLANTDDGRQFLVTALHNLSGKEPCGACKSKTDALPNYVKITGYRYAQKISLYDQFNEPTTSNPMYWCHSKGAEIDVAVLQLTGVEKGAMLHASFLHPLHYSTGSMLYVTQMCYVVGYPEGLFVRVADNIVSPIWKTGHLATEPSIVLSSDPKILIDAATYAGMSGSPVYVQESTGNRLVGIYTGRTSQNSQLGFVFYLNAFLRSSHKGQISILHTKSGKMFLEFLILLKALTQERENN